MRRLLAIWAAIAVFSTIAGAVDIEVSTDPSLEAANLLENPHVEQATDGEPEHWSFSTAVPENFDIGWEADTGRDGSGALHVVAHERVMSGYWAQKVPVTPGTYLFRGWYRTTGGRLLMYAHGRNPEVEPPVGVDARTYHGSSIASFLVPVFVPYEALTGPDPDTYYPFSVQVEVPERLGEIALSMGIYFTPGEAWFDDVWFGPAAVDLKLRVDGEGEQIAQVTVFQDGVEEPLYDSGDDPAAGPDHPLRDPFEATVPGVATGGSYLIVAKTGGGNLHRVHFPEEAQQ